ncbi:MAG TPA: sigma-54 dependent transcriptional regulator [Candidatus Sulfotelmatobacter sp.]|nr:sigma-54 dependent transcriptional regulator [Candidatus Sulfotelmatobacter sp.]
MAEHERILVIDDEEDMLVNCSRMLARFGYEPLTAPDGAAGLEALQRERPALILTDLRMPGMGGMEVVRAAKAADPNVIVIMITAFATLETAVEAIKEGAYDYVTKPFTADQLRVVIDRALTQRRLQEENQRLRQQLQQTYRFENIIGRSLAMTEVYEVIKKVASSEANILVLGESGTGKELIARCLHANSRRGEKAFIPVDLASLPENLLESELFGHEKGAFTGAHATRPGLFEYAQGGTVFLDEIAELSPNLQGKLLRVLQERQVRRVGGNRIIEVDVRVISATNRDVQAAVAKGTFREDLYYRLNVISIPLPPLRERKGDVPLIAYHYLQRYAAASGKEIRGIAPEALDLLESYHWPGNVRELQNVIERAVVLTEADQIRLQDLPEHLRARPAPEAPPLKDLPLKAAKAEWARSFERTYLGDLLKRHGGNISQAAKAAGVDRKTIHRLLKRHNLAASR